ncbi:RNA (Guanine-9-)-methyltransferase domain-containing protein 2 [Operophtera brumata]|uniref:tRNA (guanine(9)-N(1))-methyltransferase n=1 Tax=Operophtera brumata TaxID=104452 RepID=A0A0L7LQL9_OPEBR|nr:RNA (Guanine-9-)-methyltransferase domain-containing protein 2 [Operophtera brumata]
MDEIQHNLPKDNPQEEGESNGPRFKQLTLFDITFDPGMKDDDGNEAPRPYSKNMMRKWLRKVKWENGKAEKRRKEKAQAKERKRRAREENRDLGPSRKALKKMKKEKPKSGIGIIIDLSFEHLMIEKDRYKVIKQILRSYSINRRSKIPVQFHISSLGETTKGDLSRHNGYENWDIEYHEQPYTELFPKENLVYLTSESENVIESFEENTLYVIGGLVDHNQHKGLCHQIAVEQGIRHAQLPLDNVRNSREDNRRDAVAGCADEGAACEEGSAGV